MKHNMFMIPSDENAMIKRTWVILTFLNLGVLGSLLVAKMTDSSIRTTAEIIINILYVDSIILRLYVYIVNIRVKFLILTIKSLFF